MYTHTYIRKERINLSVFISNVVSVVGMHIYVNYIKCTRIIVYEDEFIIVEEEDDNTYTN